MAEQPQTEEELRRRQLGTPPPFSGGGTAMDIGAGGGFQNLAAQFPTFGFQGQAPTGTDTLPPYTFPQDPRSFGTFAGQTFARPFANMEQAYYGGLAGVPLSPDEISLYNQRIQTINNPSGSPYGAPLYGGSISLTPGVARSLGLRGTPESLTTYEPFGISTQAATDPSGAAANLGNLLKAEYPQYINKPTGGFLSTLGDIFGGLGAGAGLLGFLIPGIGEITGPLALAAGLGGAGTNFARGNYLGGGLGLLGAGLGAYNLLSPAAAPIGATSGAETGFGMVSPSVAAQLAASGPGGEALGLGFGTSGGASLTPSAGMTSTLPGVTPEMPGGFQSLLSRITERPGEAISKAMDIYGQAQKLAAGSVTPVPTGQGTAAIPGMPIGANTFQGAGNVSGQTGASRVAGSTSPFDIPGTRAPETPEQMEMRLRSQAAGRLTGGQPMGEFGVMQ
jgi:hypothetical protein